MEGVCVFHPQAEDGEEAKQLAEPSDENGVAIQSLPKEITCGFSLDTPARVRVRL
jgi:hypothetical protein